MKAFRFAARWPQGSALLPMQQGGNSAGQINGTRHGLRGQYLLLPQSKTVSVTT
jgi:hypothetical protein